jgi:hypothetical protein
MTATCVVGNSSITRLGEELAVTRGYECWATEDRDSQVVLVASGGRGSEELANFES